jgi:hypothetical protein
VTIPACEPVNETASRPSWSIAIDRRAIEMRSPDDSSMSSSRPCALGETAAASLRSSSVVSPMAETTTQTSLPPSAASTTWRATASINFGLASELPPYLRTRSATRGT